MNISTWITKLDAAKDVHWQWREIDGWITQGKVDDLVALARLRADGAAAMGAAFGVRSHRRRTGADVQN